MHNPIQALCIVAYLFFSMGAVFAATYYLTPVWDRISRARMRKLTGRYEQLGYPTHYLFFSMRVWTLLLVGTGLLFTLVFPMLPIAMVLVGIVFVAPDRILDRLILRRERRFRDQLTSASIGMTNAAQAGFSLQESLSEITSDTDKPLRSEFSRIISDNQNGVPLADAMADRRRALALDSFSLFSLTIETNEQKGGDIVSCLSSLSKSFQEEQRLQGKVESDTASGRQTMFLLAMFPPTFLLIGLFAIPDGTQLLFSTTIGHWVLAVIAALIYFGYGWALRILKIEI